MHRVKRSTEELNVNMTPMIDIVFQLIIFFVITAAMEKEIYDTRISLAFSPDGPAIEKKDPRTIVIDVHENGETSIAGTTLSPGALRSILSQSVARYGASTPVHIRGDKEADHESIRRLLDICGRAGIYRVSFLAVKEKVKKEG